MVKVTWRLLWVVVTPMYSPSSRPVAPDIAVNPDGRTNESAEWSVPTDATIRSLEWDVEMVHEAVGLGPP